MNLTQATTLEIPSAILEQLRCVADEVAREIEGSAHVTVAVVRHGDTWASICTHPDGEALGEIELSTGGPALSTRCGRVGWRGSRPPCTTPSGPNTASPANDAASVASPHFRSRSTPIVSVC